MSALNLEMVVIDRGDCYKLEIPAHIIFLDKNNPHDYFKAYLRNLFQEFDHELTKTTLGTIDFTKLPLS